MTEFAFSTHTHTMTATSPDPMLMKLQENLQKHEGIPNALVSWIMDEWNALDVIEQFSMAGAGTEQLPSMEFLREMVDKYCRVWIVDKKTLYEEVPDVSLWCPFCCTGCNVCKLQPPLNVEDANQQRFAVDPDLLGAYCDKLRTLMNVIKERNNRPITCGFFLSRKVIVPCVPDDIMTVFLEAANNTWETVQQRVVRINAVVNVFQMACERLQIDVTRLSVRNVLKLGIRNTLIGSFDNMPYGLSMWFFTKLRELFN